MGFRSATPEILRRAPHRSAPHPDPLPEGLAPLDGYLAGLGLDSGWLVIFDRRLDLPPVATRLGTIEATTPSGRTVTVIRA